MASSWLALAATISGVCSPVIEAEAATTAATGGDLRRARVGVRALGQQLLDQVHVAGAGGGVQRRVAALVGDVRVGAAIDQGGGGVRTLVRR